MSDIPSRGDAISEIFSDFSVSRQTSHPNIGGLTDGTNSSSSNGSTGSGGGEAVGESNRGAGVTCSSPNPTTPQVETETYTFRPTHVVYLGATAEYLLGEGKAVAAASAVSTARQGGCESPPTAGAIGGVGEGGVDSEAQNKAQLEEIERYFEAEKSSRINNPQLVNTLEDSSVVGIELSSHQGKGDGDDGSIAEEHNLFSNYGKRPRDNSSSNNSINSGTTTAASKQKRPWLPATAVALRDTLGAKANAVNVEQYQSLGGLIDAVGVYLTGGQIPALVWMLGENGRETEIEGGAGVDNDLGRGDVGAAKQAGASGSIREHPTPAGVHVYAYRCLRKLLLFVSVRTVWTTDCPPYPLLLFHACEHIQLSSRTQCMQLVDDFRAACQYSRRKDGRTHAENSSKFSHVKKNEYIFICVKRCPCDGQAFSSSDIY